ncbi:MAG: GntP family permease [Tetragenococcus halophilus]|uniref:GntP family permease n=1 Tax=Tetragenococcus halophilus TaxID=51669 RepID=UPI001F24AD64|nr:GntP family permease [Tetragenococcus halophilus]MDN6181956.1 GntP family permease [Staphylococcus equorum]MDN6852945.1 GntP family permease [Tetragenococcus koreensis]MCF1676614.1 GntP family permease [Tetragenococcus halophilus]MDN6142145.1 GntP family permease [Tetragenococcus halophilus]MDN6144241.1 GntP family permease [Tetragenococcus halophilus]
MELLGILGLALAIMVIIYFSFKGLSIVISAPLAAIVAILCNRMDFFSSLIGTENSFMSGLAGFLINNFAIFLLGAILGQYMDKSGATQTIAEVLLKKIGIKSPYRVLVALTIIGSVLTYGGISIFIVFFTLIPLARPIFQKLDINWQLVSIPLFLGAGTYTMSMIPGTPSIQNAIPTTELNTTLTAAPLLGFSATITILIFGFWYMKYELNKSIKKGETFYSYLGKKANNMENNQDTSEKTLTKPSFITSILPLMLLIGVILLFSNVANIMLIALTMAIVCCALVFKRYLGDQKVVLNNGANGAVGSSFGAASAVAFGSVLTNAPTFAIVQESLTNMPGPALLTLGIITALLSGVMAASGAIGTVVTQFAQPYLDMGIPAAVIHRVVVIGGGVLTVVPQSGAVIAFNSISGLDFKHGFKQAFIVSNGGFLLALIVTIILAQFIY